MMRQNLNVLSLSCKLLMWINTWSKHICTLSRSHLSHLLGDLACS